MHDKAPSTGACTPAHHCAKVLAAPKTGGGG